MIRIYNSQYYNFLQQADALRQSGMLCDVIISVQSQTFRAHRLVLACASRALAQHLAKADSDSPALCTLEYFTPQTFQQVLDFTYTQALEVPAKDLKQLLRAAQLLEMQLLEDQCRKQLDCLEARKEDESREAADLREEKKGLQETDQTQKSKILENKLQQISSPEEKSSVGIIMENVSPADSNDIRNNQKSPRRKAGLSPIPAALCNRDSVITRSNTSSSSFSPAWAFPNMWVSGNHFKTLGQISENYSNFIAAHPLPSSNQTSVMYPFSLSSQHMFPLLSSHFQTPLQNAALGYSHFHPHPYAHGWTSRMGSMIKNSLLKKKKSSQTSQTGETSFPEAQKVRGRLEDCQHCSKRVLCDPLLRESGSTRLGQSCDGCQFCGRDAVQLEANGTDHRGEKPYQCKHCPKKFSLKHQLDTHHRVHTGEKPFECRLCGQRSRDYSAMIKHLRTHDGAAPYQCTVCLEFCSSLVAMQRHIKSHAVQDFPPDWSISNTYLYISHI
uniref:Zinc finger and BTB domain containing 32 n=1 Tax=Cyprinodon variegatus TaxID=28743 RepID=A0A3Q2CGR6_CYPVA